MTEFRFPQPGELRNPEGIPVSVEDMYRLLASAAPFLIAGGESVDAEDPLNGPLHAWWNGCNALPRDVRIILQRQIKLAWGFLPPSPWEDVTPVDEEEIKEVVMTVDEFLTWLRQSGDPE